MSLCACGKYIEYIKVKSKKVIVDIHVSEKNIVIDDKDVRTNKWLLPQHWQELYDILESATARHIRNKYNSTLTTHGENLSVFLEFIPHIPAYENILKPSSCNNNFLEESGSEWLEQPPYESMVVANVSPRYSSNYQRNSSVNNSKIGDESTSKSAKKHNPSFVDVSYSADKHIYSENKFSYSEHKSKTTFSNFTSSVDCSDDGSDTHNSSSESLISTKKELPVPYVIPESDSDNSFPDFDFNSKKPQYFEKYSKYSGFPISSSKPYLSEDVGEDLYSHVNKLGTEDNKSSQSSVGSAKLTRSRAKRLRMNEQEIHDDINYNIVVDNASQHEFETKKSKVVNYDIQKSQHNAETKNELVKDFSAKRMKCEKPNKKRQEPKSATKETQDKSKMKGMKVKGLNKNKLTNESQKSCQNTIKDYFSPKNEVKQKVELSDSDYCIETFSSSKVNDISTPDVHTKDYFSSKNKVQQKVELSDSDFCIETFSSSKVNNISTPDVHTKDYFSSKNKVQQKVELSDSDYCIETFSSNKVNDISTSDVHINDSQDDFKSKKKVKKGKKSNENKVTYEPKKNCKSTVKANCDSVNKRHEEELSSDCYAESDNVTNENSISFIHLRELKLKTTSSSAHLDNISMSKSKLKLSKSLKTKAKKTAAENKLHLENEPHHAAHHSNVVAMKESKSARTETEKTDSKIKSSRQLKQKSMLTEDDTNKNVNSQSSHSSSSSEEIISLKAKNDKNKSKSLKKSLVKSNIDSELNSDDMKTTCPDLPRRSKRNNKKIKNLFGSSDDENVSSTSKISDMVSKSIGDCPNTSDEQNKSSTEQMPDGETKSDDLMEREKYKVSDLSHRELKIYFKKHAPYLHDLFTGKQTCERQEAFKIGGPVSRELRFALTTVPYKDEQLDYMLTLINKKFFRKHSFVTYFDYVMKVLLPELTTRIFMDKFSMTKQEVLNKINNIYFLSPEPIDFGLNVEDMYKFLKSREELSE